jgi:hypothetical protein
VSSCASRGCVCGRRRDPPCSRLLFCHGIATNLVRYSCRPAHFPHPGGLERASPPTRGALSFAFSACPADFHLISPLCSGSLRWPADCSRAAVSFCAEWASQGDRRSDLRGPFGILQIRSRSPSCRRSRGASGGTPSCLPLPGGLCRSPSAGRAYLPMKPPALSQQEDWSATGQRAETRERGSIAW